MGILKASSTWFVARRACAGASICNSPPRPIPAISFLSRLTCRIRKSTPAPTRLWNACWCAAMAKPSPSISTSSRWKNRRRFYGSIRSIAIRRRGRKSPGRVGLDYAGNFPRRQVRRQRPDGPDFFIDPADYGPDIAHGLPFLLQLGSQSVQVGPKRKQVLTHVFKFLVISHVFPGLAHGGLAGVRCGQEKRR